MGILTDQYTNRKNDVGIFSASDIIFIHHSNVIKFMKPILLTLYIDLMNTVNLNSEICLVHVDMQDTNFIQVDRHKVKIEGQFVTVPVHTFTG